MTNDILSNNDAEKINGCHGTSDENASAEALNQLSSLEDSLISASIACEKYAPDAATSQLTLGPSIHVASALRKKDLPGSNIVTVCIAGKNNIAVSGLKHLLDYYSHKINLCFLPNPTDYGVDDWQPSLKKFGEERNIRRAQLDELYKTEDLLFISLEYSEIIDPKKFLTNRLFNIHFSLLPKYKGMYTSALPIINGEEESGVTLHKIDSGIDTGEIIDQIRFQISEDDTARDLYQKYLDNGILLFERSIGQLIDENFASTPQPANGASYYSKKSIDYTAVKINFYKTAFEVRNQFRAFTFREYQLPKFEAWEIAKAEITTERSIKKPGSTVSENEDAFVVSTIDYNISLLKDYHENFWSLCNLGEIERLESIIHRIPDINLKNRMSWNAIIIATYNGHLALVKFLVGAGADLASTNKNGTTLLMYALSHCEKSNDQSVFEYLCSLGADWTPVDTRGKSVSDYISEKKLDRLLKLRIAKSISLSLK